MQIAIIGLGKMGGNMVKRLLRGGHQVVAFDRDAAVVESIAKEGATGASSLEDVVKFYNQGGKEKESYGLALDVRPLNLKDSEISDLVAFLRTALTAPVTVALPVIPGRPEERQAADAALGHAKSPERIVP